ncbi:hypothetical protein FCV25MIE_14713, partial [Fagus crenata]
MYRSFWSCWVGEGHTGWVIFWSRSNTGLGWGVWVMGLWVRKTYGLGCMGWSVCLRGRGSIGGVLGFGFKDYVGLGCCR